MQRKKDNRGISLIELVVAMAVMAIIGGCIYGFVATSTKSYNNVSQDVDLQEEAQIAMNQISSIVMSAQYDVTYEASTDGNNKLYIYNDDNRYVIEMDSSSNSLYYKQEARKTDATGTYINDFAEVSSDDRALLAEYIDKFNVKLEKMNEDPDGNYTALVTVQMDFKKANSEYTAEKKITVRNSVTMNEDLSVIYAEDTGAGKVTPTYTGIMAQLGSDKFSSAKTNNAQEVILTDSGDYVLPLSVSIVGNNYPSQSYSASLTGGKEVDGVMVSRVEGSNVVISKDESQNLTLTIVASAWPTLTCTIAINIKKITGIAITSTVTNPDTAFKLGSEIALGTSAAGNQLYAEVSGDYLSEADKEFQWMAGENCSVYGNTLVITSDESKIGQNFTVIAKSTKSDKMAEFSGTITARSTTLFLTTDSDTLNRGGSVQLTATDGSEKYAQKDVTYSFSVSGGASSDLFTLTSGGKLSAAKEIDYNKEYTVTVTAALSYKTDVKQSVTITVPAVALEYSLSENGTYSKKVTVPMKNLSTAEGKNTYTIYYRVAGIENGKLASLTWTQWSSAQDTFKDTVTIAASTITFKKVDLTYSGATYKYDNTYYELQGTPTVGGVALSSSPITVINNNGNISVSINENNSGYKNYSYYITTDVTNGYVTLPGTNVEYSVEYVQGAWNNNYWLLRFKETDSMKYGRTTYTSYGWGWN